MIISFALEIFIENRETRLAQMTEKLLLFAFFLSKIFFYQVTVYNIFKNSINSFIFSI